MRSFIALLNMAKMPDKTDTVNQDNNEENELLDGVFFNEEEPIGNDELNDVVKKQVHREHNENLVAAPHKKKNYKFATTGIKLTQ